MNAMADNHLLNQSYDVVIVGTGAGGGTLAYSLKDSGLRVLLLEQGGYLPQEPENWDARQVFGKRRYLPREQWWDIVNDRPLDPTEVYYVGGKTKVYGAALLRMRESDFDAVEHEGGISPAWPISYGDLELWYDEAERLYRVHGSRGVDPTEPYRRNDYPYPPVPSDDYMDRLGEGFRDAGVTPVPIPIGIDLRDGGKCQFCATCDGYPCQVLAKSDADVCCVRPAIESGNVSLLTEARVVRLVMESDHRIASLEVVHGGRNHRLTADTYVLSCGAIESPALLLSSRSEHCPDGVANSSGLVGRNLMFRNKSLMFAIHFLRRTPTVFQKLFMVMDYYHGMEGWDYPLGSLQGLGAFPLEYFAPAPVGRYIREHSIGFFAMSEDLPDPDNRVQIMPDGRIGIRYRYNNMETHRRLVKRFQSILRRCGYSYVLAAKGELPRYSGGHECGTLRFGHDPAESVLDPYCRSHDVENLYVVDGSFLPSSSAVNPGLTIMAQALRVGDHLRRTLES